MKKKISILLGAVLAMTTGLFAQNIEEGRRLTRNEQYEDAEKVFSDLIAAKPKSGEAYYFAGINYLERGDSAAAKDIFEKGLLMCPKYTMNYVGKGHLLLRSGNTTEAESMFALALKTKKKQKALVNKEIGRAYLMVKDLPSAKLLEYANKAVSYLQASNMDFEAKLLLGDAYIISSPSDATPAVEQFIMSSYDNPNDPRPLLREAKVYQRVKNYDISLLRVNEALGKDKDYAPAYRQKAELLSAMGMRDSSVYFYKEYLKRNNNLSARRMFVQSLFLNGQYNDAIEEGKALLKVKEYPNIYGIIAYSYAEKNDTSKAENQTGLEFFEQYETKFVKPMNRPLSSQESYIKGLLLSRSGQMDAGFAMHKAVLSDTSRTTLRWYDITKDLYYKAGQYDKAVTILELKKIKNNGLDGRDLYFYGLSLNQVNRKADAINAWEELLKKDSTYLYGYYLIAVTEYQLDPKDSTGRVTAAYMRWMNRMTPEEKKKNKGSIESAYYTLALIADNRASLTAADPADKANGYAKTIASYKTAISYYNQVLVTNPGDEATQARVKALEDFIKRVEKKKPSGKK